MLVCLGVGLIYVNEICELLGIISTDYILLRFLLSDVFSQKESKIGFVRQDYSFEGNSYITLVYSYVETGICKA